LFTKKTPIKILSRKIFIVYFLYQRYWYWK